MGINSVALPDAAFVFVPEDIAILRCRVMSPGKGIDPEQETCIVRGR
jgi:hypothetical protein